MTSVALPRIENLENQHEARAFWYAVATMLLTTVHHSYGAIIYHTPWRLHAALAAIVTILISTGLFRVHHSLTGEGVGKMAFWMFVIITLLIAVVGIGLFEGGYNHVLKDLLYFSGSDTALMQRLFPPPAYEMPNEALFEITGVLQFPLGLVTGWELFKTVRSHFRSDERR